VTVSTTDTAGTSIPHYFGTNDAQYQTKTGCLQYRKRCPATCALYISQAYYGASVCFPQAFFDTKEALYFGSLVLLFYSRVNNVLYYNVEKMLLERLSVLVKRRTLQMKDIISQFVFVWPKPFIVFTFLRTLRIILHVTDVGK